MFGEIKMKNFKFLTLILASLILTANLNTYAFSFSLFKKEDKTSKILKGCAIFGFVSFWLILAILANKKRNNKGGSNPANTPNTIYPTTLKVPKPFNLEPLTGAKIFNNPNQDALYNEITNHKTSFDLNTNSFLDPNKDSSKSFINNGTNNNNNILDNKTNNNDLNYPKI